MRNRAHRQDAKQFTSRTTKVFDCCVNTVREFQSWNYERTAKGELPAGDDQYEDGNNDAMDVVKGLVAAELSHSPSAIVITGGDQHHEIMDLTGLEPVPLGMPQLTL